MKQSTHTGTRQRKITDKLQAVGSIFAKKRLLHWMRRALGTVLLLTIGNAMLALSSIWLALASQGIVDAAIGANRTLFIRFAIFLILLTVFGLLLRVLLHHFSETGRARLVNEIRQETMCAFLQKKYPAMESYHSGDLTNRLMSDVQVISDGILGILPPLVNMLCRLVAASIVLLSIDWRFTCILFAVGFGILVGAALFRKPMQRLHRQVQQESGLVQALIQETLVSLRLVKASRSESFLEDKLQNKQNDYFDIQMKRKRMSILTNAGLGTIFDICWLYTLCWGCTGLFTKTLTYGTLTAMLQLVGQIQSPFAGMSSILQRFYAMTASVQRLEELMELPDEKIEDTVLPESTIGGIELQNVAFAYEDEPILKNISGHIATGDMVAITGPSGTGKSSLLFLLLGIYEPSAGYLMLTGEQNMEISPQTRKLFSYVPQGNTLFSGTLRENLTMFHPNASASEIETAAKVACVYDFIYEVGLDTRIGERGLGLSEGQAQRIAIARGLLSEAPILLLDEITSALDAQTEIQLLNNLSELPNRTCLIVTHRPAAIQFCNKQLHIENGCGSIEAIDC